MQSCRKDCCRHTVKKSTLIVSNELMMVQKIHYVTYITGQCVSVYIVPFINMKEGFLLYKTTCKDHFKEETVEINRIINPEVLKIVF